MKKFEIIWREMLTRSLETGENAFSMAGLARQFGFSTSTVFHALVKPRHIGAMTVTKKAVTLTNYEKLLLLWATERRLTKDIVYTTHVDLPILETEGLLPGSVIPTAYTAYRFQFHDVPADYDHVYVYAPDEEQLKKRFPPSSKRPNLTTLRPDPILVAAKAVSLPQLYVDLWNLPQWYSRDYSKAMYQKIEEKLGL